MIDTFWVQFETNYHTRHLVRKKLLAADFLHEISTLQKRLVDDFGKLLVDRFNDNSSQCQDLRKTFKDADRCLESMGLAWCHGNIGMFIECMSHRNILKKIDGEWDFICLMNAVEDLIEVQYYQCKFIEFMKKVKVSVCDVCDDDDIPY